MHRLLITGVGRSGTTYMYELLGRFGVSIRKEGLTPYSMLFQNDVEISWPAGGILLGIPKNVRIAHLFRHPLLVIRRFLYMFFFNPAYIDGAIIYHNMCFPQYAFKTPLDVTKNIEIACEFYCRWNKTIQSHPHGIDHTFKIEDIHRELDNILALMDLDVPEIDKVAGLLLTPKHTNTAVGLIQDFVHFYPQIKGDGLYSDIHYDDLTLELQDYTLELGYDREPPELEGPDKLNERLSVLIREASAD